MFARHAKKMIVMHKKIRIIKKKILTVKSSLKKALKLKKPKAIRLLKKAVKVLTKHKSKAVAKSVKIVAKARSVIRFSVKAKTMIKRTTRTLISRISRTVVTTITRRIRIVHIRMLRVIRRIRLFRRIVIKRPTIIMKRKIKIERIRLNRVKHKKKRLVIRGHRVAKAAVRHVVKSNISIARKMNRIVRFKVIEHKRIIKRMRRTIVRVRKIQIKLKSMIIKKVHPLIIKRIKITLIKTKTAMKGHIKQVHAKAKAIVKAKTATIKTTIKNKKVQATVNVHAKIIAQSHLRMIKRNLVFAKKSKMSSKIIMRFRRIIKVNITQIRTYTTVIRRIRVIQMPRLIFKTTIVRTSSMISTSRVL
jgi:hypothetical protein